MVRIEVAGDIAEINLGVWVSKSRWLWEQCDLLSRMDPSPKGPSNPDPDYGTAAYVVKRLGGRIVYADPAVFDPTVMY